MSSSAQSPIVGSITHARPSAGVEVLAAAPLLDLVARLKAKRDEFQRLSPNSDAGPTMEWVAGLLEDAIKAGRSSTVRLAIADAARLYGRPLSSVRWKCKYHADDLGAIKASGAWTVDRRKFSAWCATRSAA